MSIIVADTSKMLDYLESYSLSITRDATITISAQYKVSFSERSNSQDWNSTSTSN